jgi:hypothetical protein
MAIALTLPRPVTDEDSAGMVHWPFGIARGIIVIPRWGGELMRWQTS